jgi:hypothetical protein
MHVVEYVLKARCATSISPPLKEIDAIINAYILFHWIPLALVLSKCSTNFLADTMFSATT